jgi:hypothetical protein
MDSGENSVGMTGASPMRRSKPMRMIVSISSVQPAAPPGSSGVIFFQSSPSRTAHRAQGR